MGTWSVVRSFSRISAVVPSPISLTTMPKDPSALSRKASTGSRREQEGKEVHPQPPKRKGGFKIGKAHKEANGVYLGKGGHLWRGMCLTDTKDYHPTAKQIKETLIRKAKLKKQRARELAKAGYDPSSRSGTLPSTSRILADAGDGVGSDRDLMHDLSDEMDTDPDADAIRRRRPRRENDVMRPDLDPHDASSARKGKRRASPSSSEDGEDGPSADSPMLISPPSKSPGGSIHPSRRKGALASPASNQPPSKRRRLSELEEPVSEQSRLEAKAAAKKRRQASQGAWLARNRNGQPKLGRRIGAMLGKIEASMQS